MKTGHDENAIAVLWDLDGTILDSRELHRLAWHETLETEGREFSEAELAATFGQRNDTILRTLFGTGMPASEIERISDAKESRYRRLVRTRGVELLPGVETWLGRLAAAGWRQVLATSAPHANVKAILDTLSIGGFFTAVVAAEDVSHGKPDPEVFLTAARSASVPVYHCIVVEDAPAGIAAARRAGMRCIGVGPHHASLPADLAVPSLEALPEDAFEWVLEAGEWV